MSEPFNETGLEGAVVELAILEELEFIAGVVDVDERDLYDFAIYSLIDNYRDLNVRDEV
jgi:hypothetical protein